MFYAGQLLDNDDYDAKMYIPSSWTPANWQLPIPITRRFQNFSSHTNSLFKKRYLPSNLLQHQRNALRYLQKQNNFVIVQCDKNLGPAILEQNIYIRRALQDHLSDHKTYRQINTRLAFSYMQRIPKMIEA